MFGSRVSAEPERLNQGTSDEISVVGYQHDRLRLAMTVVLCVLSCGLLLLLLTWRPSIRLRFTHKPCDLQDATRILCTDIYGQEWDEEVVGSGRSSQELYRNKRAVYQPTSGVMPLRHFSNKNIKYVWDDETYLFTRLRSEQSYSSLQTSYYRRFGLQNSEATRLYDLHGENFIKIEVLSIGQIILQQIRNPFYVFQAYTIILWIVQYYFTFAICIALLSLLSIASSVWETRRQSLTLREKMTSQSEVYVIRNNIKTLVSSRLLVPGDAVVVEAGVVLEVDLLVVDGAVVVTEAVLTGESVPITKVGVANSEHLQQMLDSNLHKRHLLFSGSEVLQVRGSSQVLGVVINTGFSTFRGELVRSILFPKPIAFHLYSDFLKMLFCFVVLGMMAVVWSIYTWLNSEPPALWQEVVFNSLDLLTFVVPPILPATMTAINVWAQRRLKAINIFCLSSNYVALAGPVDFACFDKTGTLTEENLELAGAIACGEDGNMCSPVEQLHHLPDHHHLLQMALASCHTLTAHSTVQRTFTRNLLGHPMDLKIFNNINWELEEHDDGAINPDYGLPTPVLLRPYDVPGELAQLKVYPFDSRDQRMTVVVRPRSSSKFLVLIKGAPELLAEKCDPNSVPAQFEQVLTWYSLQGLRVLALAGVEKTDSWSQLSEQPRWELERGARLLGLVLFHNPLKPETAHTISLLQHASIETCMVTGDNLATAISVARECGLVQRSQRMLIVRAQMEKGPQRLRVTYHNTLTSFTVSLGSGTVERPTHCDKEKEANEALVPDEEVVLVLDGPTWQLIREHDRPLLPTLAYKGRVFARMKPDQKVQLIEELRDLGHQVSMCGDGCNDCGALKAAHVGVSLAATEASVAAPFTSTSQNIDCVLALIREGRATLVSTYASFKYNISYGFAALIIVLMHFSIQAEPSDSQYLIMDLVLITVPSLVLGNTGAPKMLVRERPTRRILHPLHIISILSFLALQALAYWLCWIYTQQQPWFEPYTFIPGHHLTNTNYENTSLVIFSFYTFIIAAVVFSHGHPYRKKIYTNRLLTSYLLVSTASVIFFTFCTSDSFNAYFNFKELPHPGFRWMLLLGAVANCIVSYMWERWVLYGVVWDTVLPWLQRHLPPSAPHQKLQQQLQQGKDWPPIVEDHSARSSMDSSFGKGDEGSQRNYQNLQSNEDTSHQIFMMRKLSKKGRFKASVKYMDKGNDGHMKNSAEKPKILMSECLPPASFESASDDNNALLKDSTLEQDSNTTYTDLSEGTGPVSEGVGPVSADTDPVGEGTGIVDAATYGWQARPAEAGGHDTYGPSTATFSSFAKQPSPALQHKPAPPPPTRESFTSQVSSNYSNPSNDGVYNNRPEPVYSNPVYPVPVYSEPIYSEPMNVQVSDHVNSSSYSPSTPYSSMKDSSIPDYSPPDYSSVMGSSVSASSSATADGSREHSSNPAAASSPRDARRSS